jgi:hypothetical protein
MAQRPRRRRTPAGPAHPSGAGAPRRVTELHTVQVVGDQNLPGVQLGNDRPRAVHYRGPG